MKYVCPFLDKEVEEEPKKQNVINNPELQSTTSSVSVDVEDNNDNASRRKLLTNPKRSFKVQKRNQILRRQNSASFHKLTKNSLQTVGDINAMSIVSLYDRDYAKEMEFDE